MMPSRFMNVRSRSHEILSTEREHFGPKLLELL